jgi:hypothetical protein
MEKEKTINEFFASIIRPIVAEAVQASMPHQEKEPEKEFLSIKEMMKLCNCCHSSVYNHIRRKKYRIYKYGGKAFVRTADVMADFQVPVMARNTNRVGSR